MVESEHRPAFKSFLIGENMSKKLLDEVGKCFGWCRIPNDSTFQTHIKQAMCSCRCTSWSAANMANHNNQWMSKLKMIKPKKKK
jgi:hypothetical protein